MIQEIIKNFPRQLEYQPEIENQASFKKRDKFIVAGMGGSNLAPGLLMVWKPEADLVIHRDYGLPAQIFNEKTWAGKPAQDSEYLIICSSYSGNTEETIDTFNEALKRNLSAIILTTGGKLMELARKHGVPYIRMPDIGVHPRLAVGLSVKAMLKAMGEEGALKEITKLADSLNATVYEEAGKNLAEKLKGKIPIVYSSNRNLPIAYYWKVNFEETSKTPAFCNAFPELNHNEMMGFVSSPDSESLSGKFHFIFLKDKKDDPRIQRRQDETRKLYEKKGVGVEITDLTGDSAWQRIFGSLSLSNWTSFYLAKNRGVDPEDILVLETFKKQMR